MFCMLLRKRLTGGRLVGIRQPGLERALYFDLDCVDELGGYRPAHPGGGDYGTAFQYHSDRSGRGGDRRDQAGGYGDVLGAAGSARSAVFSTPAEAGRLDLSSARPPICWKRRAGEGRPLSKALLGAAHGLSPLICREVSHYAARGRDTAAHAPDRGGAGPRAVCALPGEGGGGDGENRVPYILYKSGDAPQDFSFLPITQYGLSAVGREMESFSALLDAFYAQKDQAEQTASGRTISSGC